MSSKVAAERLAGATTTPPRPTRPATSGCRSNTSRTRRGPCSPTGAPTSRSLRRKADLREPSVEPGPRARLDRFLPTYTRGVIGPGPVLALLVGVFHTALYVLIRGSAGGRLPLLA